MTSPQSGRRAWTLLDRAILAICIATIGCVGPSGVEDESELTRREFEDMLERGLIEPVPGVQDESAYAAFADQGDEFLKATPEALREGREESVSDVDEDGFPLLPELREAVAPEIERNPYVVFGRRIKANPDGTIVKPFPLRAGTGAKMMKLIEDYGNFPLWTEALGPGPSTTDTVKLDLLESHDVELYQDLRNANPGSAGGQATPVTLADWLVVTTGFDLLLEIEGFINLFAAGVPQIEIEAKIVEISFRDSLDWGISPVDSNTPIFQSGSSNFISSFSFDLPNGADIPNGVATLGGILDGLQFNAIVQFLAGRDNVSIISQPKIAVREGGRAEIINRERIPYVKVNSINATGGINATLDYVDTGIQLYVVPRVVGTDTVALNIDIEAAQQSGSVPTVLTGDTSADSVIETPVVATRSARTIVYLEPGQAVILGGLLSERNVEQVRKVPFLGDIPGLGYFFKSKFIEKQQTNVLFFIRPRILQGSDLNRAF